MEHDITQGERLAAFARTCGFVDVTVHNDYTGRPRYLTAENSRHRNLYSLRHADGDITRS